MLEYFLNAVFFDGIVGNTLVDAKWDYENFVDPDTGEFRPWFQGPIALVCSKIQKFQEFAMPTTLQEIYIQIIHTLSPAQRLRLATLILNDLVKNDTDTIDQSDTWTEEDQIDLAVFASQYAAIVYPTEPGDS